MPNFVAILNRLCTPAFIYAVMHIVLLAFTLLKYLSRGDLFNSKVMSAIIMNIILIAIWAFILNYLCSINLGPVSWFLVLAPFIAMLGFARRNVSLYDPNPLSGFFM